MQQLKKDKRVDSDSFWRYPVPWTVRSKHLKEHGRLLVGFKF